MKNITSVAFAALTAAYLAGSGWGVWVYGGQWPDPPDPAKLDDPHGVAAAGDGTFYVCDTRHHRVWCVNVSGPQFFWGGYGSGPGQFIYPYNVALSPEQSKVYVTDRDNRRVQYFTLTGSFLGSWLVRDDAQFLHLPIGIAVAPNGTVFVSVGTDPVILRYTATGSYLGSFSHPKLRAGSGLAAGPAMVVYATAGQKHKVLYFNLNGEYLGEWGSLGSGPGEFWGPMGIAVNAEGTVFVVDSGNRRVQYFTSTGSYLGQWGSRGPGPGQFEQPYGIGVSPSGETVFVSDPPYDRVQWFREQFTPATPASLGRVKALYH